MFYLFISTLILLVATSIAFYIAIHEKEVIQNNTYYKANIMFLFTSCVVILMLNLFFLYNMILIKTNKEKTTVKVTNDENITQATV